jgi:hypothetical protein
VKLRASGSVASGDASFMQTNQPQSIRGIPGHVVGVNKRNDKG